MDRTTVYVDRELLAEAMRLASTKDVSDNIQLALTEYIKGNACRSSQKVLALLTWT